MAQAIRLPSYLQQKATIIHATKAHDTNRFFVVVVVVAVCLFVLKKTTLSGSVSGEYDQSMLNTCKNCCFVNIYYFLKSQKKKQKQMNNNKPVLKSQSPILVINNGKGSSVPSTFHQMLRAKHGNPEGNRILSSHRNNCSLFIYLTRHVLCRHHLSGLNSLSCQNKHV